MPTRRTILISLAAVGTLGVGGRVITMGKAMAENDMTANVPERAPVAPVEKLTLSDAEWREKLTAAQYNILREEGTEPRNSSPLLHEKRNGRFVCAGCDLPLFDSTMKYDSGTGWPSFFDVIPGHVETRIDRKFFMVRTEYHCARCGGHQGHVFEDGPPPTGLRYCNNGLALKFIPA